MALSPLHTHLPLVLCLSHSLPSVSVAGSASRARRDGRSFPTENSRVLSIAAPLITMQMLRSISQVRRPRWVWRPRIKGNRLPRTNGRVRRRKDEERRDSLSLSTSPTSLSFTLPPVAPFFAFPTHHSRSRLRRQQQQHHHLQEPPAPSAPAAHRRGTPTPPTPTPPRPTARAPSARSPRFRGALLRRTPRSPRTSAPWPTRWTRSRRCACGSGRKETRRREGLRRRRRRRRLTAAARGGVARL